MTYYKPRYHWELVKWFKDRGIPVKQRTYAQLYAVYCSIMTKLVNRKDGE